MMEKRAALLADETEASETSALLKGLRSLPVVLRETVTEWCALFERARIEDFYRVKMLGRYTPRASLAQAGMPHGCRKSAFSSLTLDCINCGRPPGDGHTSLLVKLLQKKK
jgi:hypothetical protein